MWRETFICILILLLVLVVMAWLGGCSDEQVGSPVGLDKASIGTQPDPEALVDTHILNGEIDEEFPEDQQVYPYYIVRHGPEAGVYSFSDGDTVPDGAYVVLKARASTEEPTPQQFNVQGQFTGTGEIQGGGLFSFATTYSLADLKPGWYAPHRGLASDTLGFEVGPFQYDVAMRGILNLGGNEIYRDPTPATLSFHGNYPPCVQCVEVANIETEPGYQYEDPCDDQACLEERPRLQVYGQNDPRYGVDDPEVLKVFPTSAPFVWVRAATGQIVFEEPVNPETWKMLPAIYYSYLVYLHGKDHPREHWPESGTQVQERIKAWRYQVDYDLDMDNAIIDGGGADNINFLSGFDVMVNEPDPFLSDLYIETSPELGGAAGAWALRVTVGVPSILMHAGRDPYWALVRALYAVNQPPAAGSPDEEFLAWQAEPATQEAYQAWKLTTMQFSPGTIRAIAADAATCDWRRETNSYHFYDRTRIPDPNGRRCEDGAFDQPQNGIVEIGRIDLESFATYSDDQHPVTKHFDLELYPQNDAEPFTPGEDPPGWIGGRSVELMTRAARN